MTFLIRRQIVWVWDEFILLPFWISYLLYIQQKSNNYEHSMKWAVKTTNSSGKFIIFTIILLYSQQQGHWTIISASMIYFMLFNQGVGTGGHGGGHPGFPSFLKTFDQKRAISVWYGGVVPPSPSPTFPGEMFQVPFSISQSAPGSWCPPQSFDASYAPDTD
jgi:hypothetical protein